MDEEKTVLEQIYFGESTVMTVMRQYESALKELEEDSQNPKVQKKLLELQQRMDETNAWEANTLAKTILTKLGFMRQIKKSVALRRTKEASSHSKSPH